MSRVLEAVRRRAVDAADQPALSDGRSSLSWSQLLGEVDAAAAWIAREAAAAPPGAPVALALDNGPAWVVLDLALIMLGRPSLPLPPFFTAAQRQHALTDAGVALVIAHGDTIEVAGASVSATPLNLARRDLHPGTAKITYTSGSTGAPKGVCLSLAQLETLAALLVEAIGVEFAGRHLAVLPLGVLLENVAGLYPTLLAGGCYEARPLGELGFAAAGAPDLSRLLAAVAESQATSLILVPELLRGLMAAVARAGGAPSLRLVAVGGAKVAPQLVAAARALGLPAYEGYGLSECGSVVALNTPHADRPGSVGRALRHVQLTVAADGEIVVHGHTFLGYVGGPPHVGPFPTGDLGAVDADGFVAITGRKTNTIITGHGRNVAPEWVESELLAEPEIAQAAVFGEAAAQLCALVVPSRRDLGGDALDAVIARVNARLPDYAQVGRWRPTAPFDPLRGEVTGNGRPRRDSLRATYRDFIDHV